MRKCKFDDCTSTDLATRSAMCRIHHREYTRQHYKNNKQYYILKARKNSIITVNRQREQLKQYLRNNPCPCGQKDIEVLEFDHRDRTTKITEVSKLVGGSDEKLWAEIAKCDVLCAYCHIKKTRRQMGWWVDDVLLSRWTS